jgi:hypothetical protein
MCGVARPHISHEMAERYVARASRTSGYWKADGTLRMIISCSYEGFPIDYRQGALEGEIAASFSFDEEIAAGMTPVMMPNEMLHFADLTPEVQAKARAWIGALREMNSDPLPPPPPPTTDDPTVEPGDEFDDDFDIDAAADERERELALEAEQDALA